jgi:hypothetical protein
MVAGATSSEQRPKLALVAAVISLLCKSNNNHHTNLSGHAGRVTYKELFGG